MALSQRHQDLTYSITGQSLVWDAPEGRPSSVTSVTVYLASTGDSGSTETATSGTASVETNPNTTFDAASGSGQTDPRKCNLTATTGISAGRSYLVTTAAGLKEWPEVLSITAGDSIIARNPLENAYASADTFQSTRISISVDSTWVSDQSNISPGLRATPNYRVRWVYVVSSVTYVHDTYFDVVRYAGGHTVSTADLDAMIPGYMDILPTFHRVDEGRRMLDEAYQQVRWDLQASDVNDAAIRDEDAINRATMLRFGVILAESQSVEMLEMREKRYREFFDKTFRVTAKVLISTDESAAGHRVPALSLWSK